MAKKSYAMHVSIILGSTVVLMLFIFVLVAHHRGISEQVRQDRSALLGTATKVTETEGAKPVVPLMIPSVQQQGERAKKPVTVPPPK